MDFDYSKPKLARVFETEHVQKINPLHSTETISPEFLKLQDNLELYYAPQKIVTFDEMSRQQVKEYLLTIYGDDLFCDVLAGCIKRDYNGTEGVRVLTEKEAKNWYKKQAKKQNK